MESKLANESKRRLLDSMRRLTPEQRLAAYIAHCELVMQLYAAGIDSRTRRRAAPQ